MEPSLLLENQLAYLAGINPKDAEDLLLAMPSVATLQKLSPEKSAKFVAAYQKLSQAKVDAYLNEELAYFSNEVLFNEDALEVAWLFQQFSFYLDEFKIKLSTENEVFYEKVIRCLWSIQWAPEDLATIYSWLHESGLKSKDFLPCLQYASSTATKPLKGSTQVVSIPLGMAQKNLGKAAYSQKIPLETANKFSFEKSFSLKYQGQEIETTVEARMTESTQYVIKVSSKGHLPSMLAYKEKAYSFKKKGDAAITQVPIDNIFEIAKQKFCFTLHYLGRHKVILEIH